MALLALPSAVNVLRRVKSGGGALVLLYLITGRGGDLVVHAKLVGAARKVSRVVVDVCEQSGLDCLLVADELHLVGQSHVVSGIGYLCDRPPVVDASCALRRWFAGLLSTEVKHGEEGLDERLWGQKQRLLLNV